MAFTLRDFQPQDLETLWAIDQRCFAPDIAYSRHELSLYMRRNGAFTIVAEKQTDAVDTSSMAIAGFIVAESNRRAAGHIITIDVLPEHRRSGLGSMLLATAEERLRSAGCRSAHLEAAVNNLSAIRFYKRHGYDIVAARPRYYSGGLSAFVLQKRLKPIQKTG